jgi:hypothetical protein
LNGGGTERNLPQDSTPAIVSHLLLARFCLGAGLEAEAAAEFAKLADLGLEVPEDGAALMKKRSKANP